MSLTAQLHATDLMSRWINVHQKMGCYYHADNNLKFYCSIFTNTKEYLGFHSYLLLRWLASCRFIPTQKILNLTWLHSRPFFLSYLPCYPFFCRRSQPNIPRSKVKSRTYKRLAWTSRSRSKRIGQRPPSQWNACKRNRLIPPTQAHLRF